MGNFKQLRQFSSEELLLNEGETRIVLKFIFNSADHNLIDSLPMSDYLRGFAQGLLVEAIDASYSIGYVKALFESIANPTKGAMTVIKKFSSEAAMLWFKHASVHDLKNVKIFDFVRERIAWAFRSQLQLYLASNLKKGSTGVFVSYEIPKQGAVKRWV